MMKRNKKQLSTALALSLVLGTYGGVARAATYTDSIISGNSTSDNAYINKGVLNKTGNDYTYTFTDGDIVNITGEKAGIAVDNINPTNSVSIQGGVTFNITNNNMLHYRLAAGGNKELTIGDNVTINYITKATTIPIAEYMLIGLGMSSSSKVNIGDNFKLNMQDTSTAGPDFMMGIFMPNAPGATLNIGNNADISVNTTHYTRGSSALGADFANHTVTIGDNAKIAIDSAGDFVRAITMDMGMSDLTTGNGLVAAAFGSGSAYGLYYNPSYYERNDKYTSDVNLKGAVALKGGSYGAFSEGHSIYASLFDPVLKDASGTAVLSATLNINAPGATKQFVGDIYVRNVNANLLLDTKDSYIRGYIADSHTKAEGKTSDITLAKGAQWQPTNNSGQSTVFDGKLTVKDGGVINLAYWNNKWLEENSSDYVGHEAFLDTIKPNGDFRTVQLKGSGANGNGSIHLDGAIIRVNSDLANNKADVFAVGANEDVTGGINYVQVAYDPLYETYTSQSEVDGKALVVDMSNAASVANTVAFEGQSSLMDRALDRVYSNPVVTYDAGTNKWYLENVNITPGPDPQGPTNPIVNASEAVMTAGDASSNLTAVWRNQTWLQRLGDLHFAKQKGTDTGIWARMYGGKLNINSGYSSRNSEQKYHTLEVGADHEKTVKNGKVYYGAFVNHTLASDTYAMGSGDSKGTTFGLYGTWVGEKGHYVDVVVRYGKLYGNYNLTNINGNNIDADYSTHGCSISGEYGYKKNLSSGWYVLPQMQVTLGKLQGYDYINSQDTVISQSAANFALGRVGVNVGREHKDYNVYLKANLLHDFGGTGEMTASNFGRTIDVATLGGHDTWVEVGVGMNAKLKKNLTMYGDVEKTFGADIQKKWQVNAGVRWEF